ncbi:MAG: hypothetical protein RML45_01865 [Acetobacteraceae bacterium]|nr:hypothetical protein [Acetobacteraceae bacterium]
MLGRRALLAGVAGAIAAAGSAAAREWRVLPDGCVTADGTWLAYNVFLPPGFDPAGGPYPLLVLLHGAGADEQFWAGKIRLWRAVERGIAEGRVAAPIAVMPGARDTWWVDSPMALAESWVVRDLLADVALKFPVTRVAGGAGDRRVLGGRLRGAPHRAPPARSLRPRGSVGAGLLRRPSPRPLRGPPQRGLPRRGRGVR